MPRAAASLRCAAGRPLKVTTKKIFGGCYGFEVLFPVGANNRIQGTEIDQNPGAGLTDSVVQPLQLGWHFKQADAIAGYTIFVPTLGPSSKFDGRRSK